MGHTEKLADEQAALTESMLPPRDGYLDKHIKTVLQRDLSKGNLPVETRNLETYCSASALGHLSSHQNQSRNTLEGSGSPS